MRHNPNYKLSLGGTMYFKSIVFGYFLFLQFTAISQNVVAFGLSTAPLLTINYRDSMVFPIGIGGNIGGITRFDITPAKSQSKIGYLGIETGAFLQLQTMNVIAARKLFWSIPFEIYTPFLLVGNIPYKKLPKFLKDKKRDLTTAAGIAMRYLPLSIQGGYRNDGRNKTDYYYSQWGAGLYFMYSIGFEKLTKQEFVGVKLQWMYSLYADNDIHVSVASNAYSSIFDLKNHCLSLQFYAMVRERVKTEKKAKEEPLWVDENPYIPEASKPEIIQPEKNPFPRIRSVRTL